MSSFSVLPMSFAKFSEQPSVNSDIFVQHILTHSALLDLLCRNPKDKENHDHYLNSVSVISSTCVYTSAHWKNISMNSKISIRVIWLAQASLAAKDGVTMARTKFLRRLHTERTTPTPGNITSVCENTQQIQMQISDRVMSWGVIWLTPSPRVPEIQ